MEKPLKSVLNSIFLNLTTNPDFQKKSALIECWPKIAGQFSKNTKPVFSDDGKITVWVNDSTLAFELSRRYKPVLLKRLKNQFGEDEVKDLRFLVGEIR